MMSPSNKLKNHSNKNVDPHKDSTLMDQSPGFPVLTCGPIEGVASQSQRGAALMARETAPVEELALGADALQHVDPLAAEVTLLTAGHQNVWLGRRFRDGCWHRGELWGRSGLRRL